MISQTIRSLFFAVVTLFSAQALAQDSVAVRDCGTKQVAPLPIDRSGDLGSQAASIGSPALVSLQAVAANTNSLLNRIAGETNASCCKVCRNTQACGDGCISWSKICHVGAGCACQQ